MQGLDSERTHRCYMSDAEGKTGYFLFSLDTELAWGHFDSDRVRLREFSPDGSRERRSIEFLLDILDEFGIVATWAVVGHLFYKKCEACDICPILNWKGRYQSFEEVYKTEKPLWYGADIIETLLTRGSRHEIAFHGYTHRVLDQDTASAKEARTEIQEWLRVSKRKNITPRTVIFPRNKIGYLDMFKEYGFICYRGEELTPEVYSLPLIGSVFRRFYCYLSALSVPQVYELKLDPSGLVNFPSSRWLFGFNRQAERILDSLNLYNLRIRNVVKGVKKAAVEKKIIHIWAHPYEFCTRKDIEKLRCVLDCVSDEMSRGRIQSIGMADLAQKALEQQRNRIQDSDGIREQAKCLLHPLTDNGAVE
jgi:peptidoglycan/xylan/chitin deacetylase (PgdA/CDA1 family)